LSKDKIIITGARENNLKNINLEIPRDKLVVLTGISGSGKSSLAFDTLYAEGQRRYVESLSSYARQFLGQMEKPQVDSIEGLSPAISIDQKTTNRNPRSTVGTVTEIYDYLRLLYARIGIVHCPVCDIEISRQTTDQMVDKILEIEDGTKIQIMAPIVRGRKGEHVKELESARKSGFVRARVDGIIYDLSEQIKLEKNKKHSIEIVVDRLVVKPEIKSRLADSIETAISLTNSLVLVDVENADEILFSTSFACPIHGSTIGEIEPRMFSFNNPFGACEACTGLGEFMRVDPDLVVPDKTKSLAQGAINVGGWNYIADGSIVLSYYKSITKHFGGNVDMPWQDLPQQTRDVILYGTKERFTFSGDPSWRAGQPYESSFRGVTNNIERRYNETTSEAAKSEYESKMVRVACDVCGGKRLNKQSLAVTVGEINIMDLCDNSIDDTAKFFANLTLTEREMLIADLIIREIKERLNFLQSVGLNYLSLSRSSGTLSGGESQRIRLATQIGSSLVGVLYILDEPSIGLHQRDNDKLLATLQHLRNIGNTLIIVEHDEDTMRAADYIIDIGPGAGVHGGEVVAIGTPAEVSENKKSITGDYLSGRKKIAVPAERRAGNGNSLKIVGAAQNNLKKIDATIPLGVLTAVTGVSGSGKSSLINEILYKKLAHELNRARTKAGNHAEILGIENLDKVIEINQSPIGRTPRSNPATYTGVFNDIRELFSQTNESKKRGYAPGRFSFNVKGGRCEACQGDGIIRIEMHFLPDVYVPCEVCKAKRYSRETLEILYKGKSIADVLDMTVAEACEFFKPIPKIFRKLNTLNEVGLSYIKIGQSATTLSGGEAQRVKLATELSKRATGKTIYILDEPTTGLHTADVAKLIEVLHYLVEQGNSVVVIEHNLDVIKSSDYCIDLGPEGGDKGGQLVAYGTPEEVAKVKKSHTGFYLKKVLS